ncbi:MAG: polyhydroxybutyrate depolymerase [Dehalococcoidia bacterium]|nr:polyhydroxybutyrate depolymerase [Dehalococcoidia bacterium]
MRNVHFLVGVALVAAPLLFLAGCRERGSDERPAPASPSVSAGSPSPAGGGTPSTDGNPAATPTPRRLQFDTGTTTGTIRHDGLERSYRLFVPAGARGDSNLALVVALHGGLGTGDQFAENSRFEDTAETEGFVVVFPNGVDRTWNAGACCGGARRKDIDDVGFLAALIEHLGATLPVSRERVFVTGHSNGAMMAFRFACERSDMVAAAAPVAGSLEVPVCAPATGVDLLAIHGDSDRNHPIEGGEGTRSISGVSYVSMEESMRRWTAGFGCDTQPATTTEGALTTTTWGGCADGRTASLIVIAGADHPWPGGVMPSRTTALQGVPSQELDATRAVWEFFASR